MKKILLTPLFILLLTIGYAQDGSWKIVEGRITTPWAKDVDPAHTLPEYPRPQMIRNNWTNLNGLWQYAIAPLTLHGDVQTSIPNMQGSILVPFAVESALSGVGKTVGKDSVLWYKRSLSVSDNKNKNILLHFGAVDWMCTVYVNGKEVGMHKGGYDPFTIDISKALKKGAKQELAIRVWDPSDDGPQPRGKQVKKPAGIWYTSVTGIWQTVWLEAVPKTYIEGTRQTPDIDNKAVRVMASVENVTEGDKVVITAWDGPKMVAQQTVNPNTETSLAIPEPKLWSPESPFLYDLKLNLVHKGKVIDEVKSYFAMRKISMKYDAHGIQRMALNNQFIFQYGPLDQGWWPEGLYTAPTEAALRFDIDKTKEMGFNMIRKHVKVEPALWYRHCDEVGMLVWQDMPSGDLGNRWDPRPGIIGRATDKDRTSESESIYRTEWNEIMQDLYNFPSIVIWTPFNEGWGQFKTKEIAGWTMQKDPSRLVNTASGGNFENIGPIIDLHNYPEPAMPDPALFGSTRAIVLGEFGGLGLPVESHTWQAKNNWGYQSFKSGDSLFARYSELVNHLPALIEKGLSAAVYTQTTDVEIEVNGLMTYDRKVIKMPVDKLKALHEKLYQPALVTAIRQ